MSRRNAALLSLTALAFVSCVNVISHEPKDAAQAAAEFAEVAFVERDLPRAHGLMSEAARRNVPMGQFTDLVAQMHPNGYPTEVSATEFEPIPGQRAMNIFLRGTGGGEEFYYRFVLEGDARSGYRVTYLGRGSGPYPPSPRRKPL